MTGHSVRRSALRRVAALTTATTTALLLAAPSVSHAQKEPTGDPIKIMTIGEFEVTTAGSANPEVSGAVEARAEAINKAGGLEDAGGVTHEVEVIVCNTDNDPNKAATCARDAVDQGVVATVGNYTAIGGEVYPVLEAAGIPSIGPFPSEPQTLTSPVSVPLSAGIPSLFFELPRLLADAGAKKISIVYPDLPAAGQLLPLIDLAAQKVGVEVTQKVPVALDAADLAPQVAAATGDGAEGIMMVIIGDQTGRFVTALQQQGFDGKIATPSAFLTPALLDEVGDALDGALVANNFQPATAKKVPGVKRFVKDMNKFDKLLFKSDIAMNSWLATYLFENLATDLPEITPAALLEKANTLEDFDMLGVAPPFSTTAAYKGGPFQFPRMFNVTVVDAQVKKGKVVRTSPEFADPFA